MKKLIFLILILNLVSFCLASEDPKETELFFMARKAYEDGFYEVSLGMLERFEKEYSNSQQLAQVRLLSGQCYFQQGRYLESLNIFEKLLKDHNTLGFRDAVYFWIAEVHFKGGNFEKAAQLYQKLITEFSSSSYAANAYYSLGWSFAQMGKFNDAISAFNSLLQKFPNEPQSKDAAFKLIECLYNIKEYLELKARVANVMKLYTNDNLRLPYLYFYLAEAEYYLDEFDEAAKNYLKTGQLSKDEKVVSLSKLGLGWSYFKLDRYKDAEDVFQEIKEANLDERSLDIFLLGKALLMTATNRVYESKKLYENLIKVSSDSLMQAQGYLGKAQAHFNLSEYKESADTYKEGLEKFGKETLVPADLTDKMRYNLALAYLKGGGISLSLEMLEEMELKSKDKALKANLLLQVADYYLNNGKIKEAQGEYGRIVKNYPDSGYADYAQYQIGIIQLKSFEYDAAIYSFKSLINGYPKSSFFPDALYSLGAAYFEKSDFTQSSLIFLKFRDEIKNSQLAPKSFYMLGVSLVNLGRVNEAIEAFKDIVRLYPQDKDILQKAEYQIADCYFKIGQENEALNRFKLLRTKYPDSNFAPLVMFWLGQYYYRANDLNLSRRYFTSLTRDFPDNPLSLESLITLGDICYKQQDFENAKSFYYTRIQSAQAKEPADLRFKLAQTLEANSEFDPAIQQYLVAADLSAGEPDFMARSLLRAAKIYEDRGNFKEALVIYKKVAEKETQEAKFAQEKIDFLKSAGLKSY